MGIWHISCLFPSFWFWLKSSIHNVILEQVLSATWRKQSVRLISNFAFCQILPVSIKSLAGSFATLANWLTSFGITMTANLLLSWSAGGPYTFVLLLCRVGSYMIYQTLHRLSLFSNCTGTFAAYMIVSAFTLVFVILRVPETKGRTLEEIQWSFRWAPAFVNISNGSSSFFPFRWQKLVHIISVPGYSFPTRITG